MWAWAEKPPPGVPAWGRPPYQTPALADVASERACPSAGVGAFQHGRRTGFCDLAARCSRSVRPTVICLGAVVLPRDAEAVGIEPGHVGDQAKAARRREWAGWPGCRRRCRTSVTKAAEAGPWRPTLLQPTPIGALAVGHLGGALRAGVGLAAGLADGLAAVVDAPQTSRSARAHRRRDRARPLPRSRRQRPPRARGSRSRPGFTGAAGVPQLVERHRKEAGGARHAPGEHHHAAGALGPRRRRGGLHVEGARHIHRAPPLAAPSVSMRCTLMPSMPPPRPCDWRATRRRSRCPFQVISGLRQLGHAPGSSGLADGAAR
jgi:hypothetical protein